MSELMEFDRINRADEERESLRFPPEKINRCAWCGGNEDLKTIDGVKLCDVCIEILDIKENENI